MSSFREDFRPRARKGVAERIIDGEALLVNAQGGEILVLNESGALVWQMCDGAHDLASIVTRVCEEQEVDRERALADVSAFLAELTNRGALD